jgi:NhaP-type Na+/H+ or K+/H+ antiporter
VLWYFLGEAKTKDFAFNHETFFNFFLPPIIFKAGYTMRKRTFFENLGNTAMFGVGATFICFAIYSLLTWVLVFKMDLQMTNHYARKKHIDTSYYAENPSPVSISIM